MHIVIDGFFATKTKQKPDASQFLSAQLKYICIQVLQIVRILLTLICTYIQKASNLLCNDNWVSIDIPANQSSHLNIDSCLGHSNQHCFCMNTLEKKDISYLCISFNQLFELFFTFTSTFLAKSFFNIYSTAVTTIIIANVFVI